MARRLDPFLDFAVVPGYTRLGYRLRGLSWPGAVAGSLAGKTALVTGASAGLGEAACEGLARAGAQVQMLVRNRERGDAARERILASLGHAAPLEIELCDLASLASIRQFADGFRVRESDLHVLVNNAGVLPAAREHTADGLELTFATNVIAPFLLTHLLLEPLRRAGDARVINVSSGGMYTARLDADDPQLDGREFDGPAFYAHTKRAEVVLTELWARHPAAAGIGFHSMHPGWADTPGVRTSLPRFHRLMRPLLRDVHQGADTIVWLATAPEVAESSGELWHDRRRRPKHRLPSTRETAEERERFWARCEQLAGLA
jgi:NAD(P)-dependent dehydrogenase (short-subunit alcohol dehydrogenase family)